MARKKLSTRNTIEPSRPSGTSLTTRAGLGVPSGDGKNKSVWQTFVDASGFAKRHPEKSRKTK
tara:strand:+ start:1006 stop:1194 length:189 start_codon:yes stop_codon:yes gene_type:complete